MGNHTNELNWAARERLRSIELRLWWRGWVGRGELNEDFGISPAQASSDLQRYLELNEGAMFYQTSRKRYESTAAMTPVIHRPVLEEGIGLVMGEMMGARWQRELFAGGGSVPGRVAAVELPLRQGDLRVERMVLLAAGAGKKLRVKYASVNSGKSSWRELCPRAFGWDGRRWHARAFCLKNDGWRDFVLGRIEEAEWPEGEVEVPRDGEWKEWEVVRLRINPALSNEKRRALRMDYGLDDEVLEIRTRKAMRGYVLAEMYLGEESGVEMPRHFELLG